MLVGSVPFQLVSDTVQNLRFNQIHTAARIRSLKIVPQGQPVDVEGEHAAFETAQQLREKEIADPIVIQQRADETLDRLNAFLGVVDFRRSSDELLRQVLVMAWGAFEAFASDLDAPTD